MTDMALSGPGRRRWQSIVYFVSAQRGILLAIAIFAVMFGLYGWKQEVGLTANIINTAANKGALLALVAMAQTIPVLTGGDQVDPWSKGVLFDLWRQDSAPAGERNGRSGIPPPQPKASHTGPSPRMWDVHLRRKSEG